MSDERNFGSWLRRLRYTQDLTQEMLAEMVGCASQTIRSFESGRRRPSRELAVRLSELLGVPADERAAFVRLARTALAQQPRPVDDDALQRLAPAPSAAPLTMAASDTGLIGRQHEEERLRRALLDEGQRLVTLLGPGGVGKTRLALQTVAALGVEFTASAVVELASVSDVAGVVAACAAAVGSPPFGAGNPQAALISFLSERRLLLLLDNLEQLLTPEQAGALTDFLAALIRGAPGVALLVTSRERLRLQAEWVIELGGLRLPADDQPATISHSDAVLLFVERARRVTDDFALTQHNQQLVAQICRRLDGLPLALELAAAQVSFLPPQMLLARLDQALPLLEGGPRDLPARQQTMRATIGWSRKLLSADEGRLFERLGVFLGGFSLHAAEALGVGDVIADTQVLGLLRRLMDRSLVVRAAPSGDEVRYRLLEPVRQYALEQLQLQSAELADAQQRHARFFQELARAAFRPLRGPEQARWVALLEQEIGNLQAAMSWLLAQGQLTAAAEFGYALWLFLWLRGHFRLGQGWMARILEGLPSTASLARAQATLVASILAYGQAEYSRALPLAEASLALYHGLGDAPGVAYSVAMVGLIAAGLGDDERATTSMAEAVERNLALDDPSHTWSAAMTLTYWAPIALKQGDYAEAARLAEQALGLARSIGDRIGTYSALSTLALVRQAGNNLALARDHFGQALLLAAELGDVGNMITCLNGLCSVVTAQGKLLRAVRLAAAAEAALGLGEAARYTYTIDRSIMAALVATLRERLDPATFATAWAEGAAMPIHTAVAYALEEDAV